MLIHPRLKRCGFLHHFRILELSSVLLPPILQRLARLSRRDRRQNGPYMASVLSLRTEWASTSPAWPRKLWISTFWLCLGVGLLGCATTSQIQALEEKTQQALKKAEEALKECQSAIARVAKQNIPAVDLVSALRPGQRITLLALDHRSGRTGYVQVVVP